MAVISLCLPSCLYTIFSASLCLQILTRKVAGYLFLACRCLFRYSQMASVCRDRPPSPPQPGGHTEYKNWKTSRVKDEEGGSGEIFRSGLTKWRGKERKALKLTGNS